MGTKLSFHYSIEVSKRIGKWVSTRQDDYYWDTLPASAIGDVVFGIRESDVGSIGEATKQMATCLKPFRSTGDLVVMWTLIVGDHEWESAGYSDVGRTIDVLKQLAKTKPR